MLCYPSDAALLNTLALTLHLAPQVEPMLASVAHTDLRQDSLARVGWHEECEASVNEQIKCDLQAVHIFA